ncbi:hypothetical protein [Exiguobacterium mexicanum]|uniref:hypothetical protein n=1 Tax=Exiguobacterium mexicanum TaxID=340146 RepID=UPI0037C12B00
MAYEEESRKGVIVIVYPLQFTSRLSEAFLGRLRDEYEVLVVTGQTVGLTAEDHKLLIKNTLREASQYKLPIHVIAFSLGALLTNRLLQEYDVPLGSLTYISPLFDWHPSRQIGGLKQVVASAVDRFRPDLPLGMMTFMGGGEESSRFGRSRTVNTGKSKKRLSSIKKRRNICRVYRSLVSMHRTTGSPM